MICRWRSAVRRDRMRLARAVIGGAFARPRRCWSCLTCSRCCAREMTAKPSSRPYLKDPRMSESRDDPGRSSVSTYAPDPATGKTSPAEQQRRSSAGSAAPSSAWHCSCYCRAAWSRRGAVPQGWQRVAATAEQRGDFVRTCGRAGPASDGIMTVSLRLRTTAFEGSEPFRPH